MGLLDFSGGSDSSGNTSGLPAGQTIDSSFSGSGGSFDSSSTNNSLTAGLNMLFTDPGAFFGILGDSITGNDSPTNTVNTLSKSEIQNAATGGLKAPKLPGTGEIVLILVLVGVIVVGIGYTAHKVLP